MTNTPHYIKAKIKDRDQFKQVFPLPVDSDDCPAVGKFILSILGETIHVRHMTSLTGGFYYISDIDPRFIILPNWIEYFFDTVELVPVQGDQVELLVVDEVGVVL